MRCSTFGPSVRDGAHCGPFPVVPCAQLISGQPPGGGSPRGVATVPETATMLPSGADTSYSTRTLRAADGSADPPENACDRMTVPGPPAGSGAGGV